MELPLTLPEFEEAATEVLDRGARDYLDGGAGDELTLRDNLAAWQRLALLPRVMVDVSAVDTSTTLLGRERPHPLIVAPMAFHGLFHPTAEPATARAAAATGTPFTLSTLASTDARQLAAEAPDSTRWFQLYVFRDRGLTREIVAVVKEHGFEALVLTVDVPVLGVRERDIRSQYRAGDHVVIPSVRAAGHDEPMSLLDVATKLLDASLTWDDVSGFAVESGLPVLVKGVLDPADARAAVAAGATGVIVSNHGGRQLDTVPATADVLPGIVEAVAGEIDVLVDGGVRRGTDVVKALALGAQAVLVGRPVLWGLASGGERGARRVLRLMLADLERTLALSGAPKLTDLTTDRVQPAPWR
jgi:4-hydroxymandelate oxidase